MKRARMAVFGIGVIAVGLAAWWIVSHRDGRHALRPLAAHLAVEWSGKYRGHLVLPVRVNWCPVTRIGWLEGVSGDSGFAIAFYEREALTGTPHPLVTAELVASAPRPAATAALRWMHKESAVVVGFRARGGTVRVELLRGLLSGDINGQMVAWSGLDTLSVHGVFRDVPVVMQAVGCT